VSREKKLEEQVLYLKGLVDGMKLALLSQAGVDIQVSVDLPDNSAETAQPEKEQRASPIEGPAYRDPQDYALSEEQRANKHALMDRKRGEGSIIREINGRLHKICPRCYYPKDVEKGWSKSSTRKDGLAVYCKDCVRDIKKGRGVVGADTVVPVLHANVYNKNEFDPLMQVCQECKLNLPFLEFSTLPTGRRSTVCKSCTEKRDREALASSMVGGAS
jgi:hypothetical protein